MENEMNVNVPLEVVKASEIEPKEVKWLWYPYIPFGKVTLLQGDPGDGKSKLMLSIAALLSKGEPLPFTEEETEPMTVIYQTTEDDADDTVVPRFNFAERNIRIPQPFHFFRFNFTCLYNFKRYSYIHLISHFHHYSSFSFSINTSGNAPRYSGNSACSHYCTFCKAHCK